MMMTPEPELVGSGEVLGGVTPQGLTHQRTPPTDANASPLCQPNALSVETPSQNARVEVPVVGLRKVSPTGQAPATTDGILRVSFAPDRAPETDFKKVVSTQYSSTSNDIPILPISPSHSGNPVLDKHEHLLALPRGGVRKEYEAYLRSIDELLTDEERDPHADARALKILRDFLIDELDWLTRYPKARPEDIVAEFQDSWTFHSLHGPHGPRGHGASEIVRIVIDDQGDCAPTAQAGVGARPEFYERRTTITPTLKAITTAGSSSATGGSVRAPPGDQGLKVLCEEAGGHSGVDHPPGIDRIEPGKIPLHATTEPSRPRLSAEGCSGVLPTLTVPTHTSCLVVGGTSLRSKTPLPAAREHGQQKAGETVKYDNYIVVSPNEPEADPKTPEARVQTEVL